MKKELKAISEKCTQYIVLDMVYMDSWYGSYIFGRWKQKQLGGYDD
jgi:hypothetical protein